MTKQSASELQSNLSEHDFIAAYFAPLAGEGSLGLLDDAAIFKPSPNHEMVITTDALVAGVHFFSDDHPASIARKALGVNLSDLAAKGATPRAFVLNLALNHAQDQAWINDFAQGLAQLIEESGCALIGGDTVKTSGALMIAITAFGEVPAGRMVQRSGVKYGDYIVVTGTIGDAALGLKLREQQIKHHVLQTFERLTNQEHDFLIDRYLHPQPRLGLRKALLAYANSAMDISDGLIGDMEKLLKAARAMQHINYGAHILLPHVPLSNAAQTVLKADASTLDMMVTGGDDYEILCTVTPSNYEAFVALARAGSINVTIIGHVTQTGRVIATDYNGDEKAFSTSAYSHF